MKELSVDRLKSGMVLSNSVKTKRGQTIAKAGTVLNHQLIARLQFYHIETVDVENEIEEEPAPAVQPAPAPVPQPAPAPVPQPAPVPEPAPAPVPEPAPVQEPAQPEKKERTFIEDSLSFSQKLGQSPEFIDFQMAYTISMEQLKKDFEAIKAGDMNAESELTLKDANALLQNRTPLELFDMIHNMRSLDDSVYAHSLNVALIARVIGKWLKFDRDELQLLLTAGLLHDIGKTVIPDAILNKKGKLTDEEFAEIKKHTIYGHKILRTANADQEICLAALQHHERADGSGYPRGLEGDEISTFASIIAIADVYDAMTAARPYRAPLCAFQVIEEFQKDGMQKYNPKHLLTFLKHVASLYNNSRVILNDGRAVRIVYINSANLARPIVEEISTGKIIDLTTEPSLHITATV